MNRNEKIWGLLAAIHLTLVVCGAAGVSFWNWGKLGAGLSYYGLVTGASSSYGFFAPGIGTGLRAQFDVYDLKGQYETTDVLETGTNRETDLRIYDIIETLSDDIDNDQNRKLLGASWAGKIFSRHPEASRVFLRVETIDIPTMMEYREGVRYGWEPRYRADFHRRRTAARD
jgi:hypothetical protein